MSRETYSKLGQLLYGVCRDRYSSITEWINDTDRHYRGSYDLPKITDELNELLCEFDKLKSYELLKLLPANSSFSVAKAYTELEYWLEIYTENIVLSGETRFPFRRFELMDGSALLQGLYGQFHLTTHSSWFEKPASLAPYNKFEPVDNDRYGSFMPPRFAQGFDWEINGL